MTEIRDAVNGIVKSVTERERTDVRLPPLMVAIIVAAYIVVVIYYISQLYSKYDSVPLPQIFTLTALFTVGAGLLIAIFHLLMSRNNNHLRREAELRMHMIEYAEACNFSCGADLSPYTEKLRMIDADIRDKEIFESDRVKLIVLILPLLIGALLIALIGKTDVFITIVCGSFGVSLLLAIIISPTITTFPMMHELRNLVFYKEWNKDVAPILGLSSEPVERTIGYRSFWLSLILTIVTVGFFAVFWIYAMFRDMNAHFEEQWYFEDSLLKDIREKEIAIRDEGVQRGRNYVLEDQWA